MNFETIIVTLCATIPFYFLTHWVLKKFNLGPVHKRKKIAVFSAAVLSPLIFVMIVSLWISRH